ncbi:MAG: hypothetical protein ABSC03_17075, partial [Verrucomicrobiota bacterium]
MTGSSKQITGASGLTFTTLTVSGTYLNNNPGTLTVSTALSGAGTLTQGTTSPTLAIGGTSGITGLDATSNTPNTVNYTGAGQTVKAINYYHLAFSGSGTMTLPGSTTAVGGNFTTSGTESATAAAAINVTGNVTLGSGTTFNGGSFTHTVGGNWSNNGGTFTPSSCTITFNSTTAGQTIGGSAASQTFNNLIVNDSGQTVTVGGSTTTLTVSGDLTLTSGTLAAGTATTINLAGNWANNSSTSAFTAGSGTVSFTGASKTIGGSSSTTFAGLSIATGATVTLNTGATCGTLTFAAAGTASSLTHSGSTLLTVNGAVTINQPSAAVTTAWNINGGTATVSGLITFAGGSGTANLIGKVVITTGTLNANGGMTFVTSAAANKVIDMSGGAGNLNLKGALTVPASSSTLTAGTSGSVFNYADSTAQTVNFFTAGAYNILHFNNAGGATLSAVITSANVTGDIAVQTGTLANGGLAITLASGKNFSVASGATFNLTGTSSMVTVSSGTKTFGATSTVNYAGTAQNVSAEAYGSLTLSGGNTKTLQAGTTSVAGDLTIAASTTFAAGANNFSLAGNWFNNGTSYSSSAGQTVTFNGAGTQSIGGSTTTTFNTLALTGVQLSLAASASYPVTTFSVGGIVQASGTWGSSSSTATHKNDTYFAATTGKLNVSTGIGPVDHFVVTTPGTQTAGTAFAITTITAQDLNNATATSFIGTVDLTETGGGAGGTVTPSPSSGFSSGVLSGQSVTLSKAGSGVTITATDHAGTGKTGASGTFTVNAGTVSAYKLSATTTSPTVGVADQLTVTQVDAYGNATSLNGDVTTLVFSGLPTTGGTPTVTDKNGTARTQGTTMTLTFANGVSSSASGAGVLKAYTSGSQSLHLTDGSHTSTSPGGSGDLALTPAAGTVNAYKLSATTTSPTVGVADQLTVTQVDQYGNATSLNGDVTTLVFSGLPTTGGTPTVTDKNGTAQTQGTTMTLTFASGVSSSASGAGVLKAYTSGSQSLHVTDGTYTSTGTGGSGDLALTPAAGTVSAYKLSAASTTPTAGATDQLTVTQVDQYGNATSLSGTVTTLVFSGLPTTGGTPTVTDTGGTARNQGTTMTLTFASGVSSSASGAGVLKAYTSGSQSLHLTDGTYTSTGTGGSGDLALTVSAAADSAYRITAATTAPVVGASDVLTITIVDQYQNLSSYSGSKTITFGGLSAGADGSAATVAGTAFGTGTSITFSSGTATGSPALVAHTAESSKQLTASSSSPTLTAAATGGAAPIFSPTAATQSAFRITAASSTPTAGAADQLTITAVDQYQNTVTSYTGSHSLTFSGLASSPGGTAPTVTTSGGTATALGTATAITFTSGVSSAGGSLVAYDAQTATLAGNDGTYHTTDPGGTGAALTVGAATDNAYRITASTTTPQVGASDTLTITIVDQYQNQSSYTGSKTITFGGLSAGADGSKATVAGTDFGTGTTISFSGGAATGSPALVAHIAESSKQLTASSSSPTLTAAATGGTAPILSPTAGADNAYRITASTTTPQVGASDTLTITIVDQYQNLSSYTGSKTITFGGLSAGADGSAATVAGTAFGTGTTISFSGGAATGSPALVAHKAESSKLLTATDGALTAASTGGTAPTFSPTAAADSAYR